MMLNIDFIFKLDGYLLERWPSLKKKGECSTKLS